MKRINYFVAMAAALAIGFTSCSKDSDPAPAEDIAKEYKGDVLVVTNAGETVPDGTMTIAAVDATNATLTLSSIVNGQSSIDIPATVIQATTGYAFEGKKDIDGMKIAVKGTVIDGKATADVAVEITAQEILNSWTYFCETDKWGNKTYDPLIFDLKTYSGKMYSYEAEDSISVEEGLFMIPMLSQMLPTMFTDLQFVFAKNGYVSIKVLNTMGESPTKVDLPNIARYYFNPAKKQLVFDAPLGNLLSKSTVTPSLGGTMQVAFDCTFKDGKLEATLDKELLNMLISFIPEGDKLDPILGMLDPVMPPAFETLLPWVKNMVKSIAGVFSDKKNFESFTLGGRLMPFVEAEK